jgi:hypothetical protein
MTSEEGLAAVQSPTDTLVPSVLLKSIIKTPPTTGGVIKHKRVSFIGTEEFRFEVGSPPVQRYAGFTPNSSGKKKAFDKVTLQQQLEARNIEPEDEATEEALEKQVNTQFCKELKQELTLLGFECPGYEGDDVESLQLCLQVADILNVRGMFSCGIHQFCKGPGIAEEQLPQTESMPDLPDRLAKLQTKPLMQMELSRLLLLRKDSDGMIDRERDYAHGRRCMTIEQFVEELSEEGMETELSHLGVTVPALVEPEEEMDVIPLDRLFPQYSSAALYGKSLKTMNIQEMKEEMMMRGITLKNEAEKRRKPYLDKLRKILTDELRVELRADARMGHMSNILTGKYESQMTEAILELMKQELNQLSLSTDGDKNVLFRRLCNAFQTERAARSPTTNQEGEPLAPGSDAEQQESNPTPQSEKKSARITSSKKRKAADAGITDSALPKQTLRFDDLDRRS